MKRSNTPLSPGMRGKYGVLKRTWTTSYKEVKIGNTIYRVTSVFTGEKDLGKTLEQLAIRRAMAELTSCDAGNGQNT